MNGKVKTIILCILAAVCLVCSAIAYRIVKRVMQERVKKDVDEIGETKIDA